MFYKKICLVALLVVFLVACGGGDPSSEDDSRPLLILDSTNAASIAISALEDVDYFLKTLFELIVQVNVSAASPDDLDAFSCSLPTAEDVDYIGGGTVGTGDSFSITLDACVVGSSTFDGDISIDLGIVSLLGDSYNGRIQFDDFSELIVGAGSSTVLDGRLDFGVDVTTGGQAIIIDDSDLDVRRHDSMPANEFTENYRNLDLGWSKTAAGALFLDLIRLDVDSEAFDGSFSVQTLSDIERIAGDDYPTTGDFLFSGASSSSYQLSADSIVNMTLDQSLDSDGNGEDAVQPTTAPTWPQLFPEDFLVPSP